MSRPKLFIDFDSTFVSLESLDELAAIALADHPHKTEVVEQIHAITNAGMVGEIDYATSLSRRLELFQPTTAHIHALIELLQSHITPSFERNASFLRNTADSIYIISGGFTDYIWPVVKQFGLHEGHVLGNKFTFDSDGQITGYDETNYLAQDHGKSKQIAVLKLDGPIWMIGDGYTDYQVKVDGIADKFLAFTENVSRPPVTSQANLIVASFDEVISALT